MIRSDQKQSLLNLSDDYTNSDITHISLLSRAGHNFTLIRILAPVMSHGIMISLSMSLSLPLAQPSTPSRVFELGGSVFCYLSDVLFLFVCMQLHNQLLSAETTYTLLTKDDLLVRQEIDQANP